MNRCFRLASSKCFPFQLAATLSLRRLRALLAVAAVFPFCLAAMAQSAHYGGITSSFNFTSPSWVPLGIAVDSQGDLFIADNQLGKVYEVQASNGVLPASPTPVAIVTGFNQPYGLAFDGSGNLFVADAGNHAIKEIVAINGVVSSSSSVATFNTTSFSWPKALAFDSAGSLFVIDENAPNAIFEFVSNGQPLSTSTQPVKLCSGRFTFADSLSFDSQGNLYVADNSVNTVFEIVASGGLVSGCSALNTVASGLNGPVDVVADAAGNLFVSENDGGYNPVNQRLNNDILEIAAGSWTNSSTPTIKVLQSGLWDPLYLALGRHGELYVADTNDYAIKTIAVDPPDFGSVGVGSTSATVQVPFTFDSDKTLGGTAVVSNGANKATGQDFVGTSGCQAGELYSAGQSCLVAVQFSPQYPGLRLGAVELLDSSFNIFASVPLHGIGTAPQLVFLPAKPAPNVLPLNMNNGSIPWGVAVDANKNVYFSDLNNATIGMISGSTQQETLFSYTNYFSTPQGIALDGAGNLFVADSGSGTVSEIQAGYNGQIYATSNIVSIGSGFYAPTGIAVDGLGNVFVADTGNNAVYEIVADSTGQVTSNSATLTIASGFNAPTGLAMDASGNLYLADTGNGAVKEIVAVNGHVSSTSQVITISTDFPSPTGVAVDAAGNMYVSDGTGIINVFLTGGVNLSTSSTFLTLDRGLSSPTGIAVSANGDVYFADQNTGLVQQLALSTPPSELDFITPTGVGTVDTADGAQSLTLVNNGNTTLNFPLPLPGASSSFALSGDFLWSDATGCSPYGTLTLASGFPCVLIIDFKPTVSGPISGSVSFQSNSLNAASPNYAGVSIALNGTGSTQPILSVGALLSIGYVQAGVTTPTLVAVENSGGAPLTIASIVRTSGASDFSLGTGGTCPIGSAIAANTGCAIEIDYSPAAGFTGPESAVFTITSDGGTKNFTFSAYSVLSMTQPVLVASSATLDFGATTIGAEAWKWDQGIPFTQLTLTLTNYGGATLNFSDLTTTTGVEDFYWPNERGNGPAGTCTSSALYGTTHLATGQSCTIQYNFLPWLNGARQGNLHIGSNAVSGDLNVTLTGVGVLPAGVLAVIPQQGASSVGGKAATIDPTLHKVFAVSGGHLTEVDTNTLAYNSLSMSGLGTVGPLQLALDAATGTIYGESEDGFYAINEATGTANFTSVANEYFYDIAVNPVANKAFLTDYGSHIGIVDGNASNAYSSINTSGSTYLFSTTALAVDTTHNLTYVLDNYVGKIAVVSGSTLQTPFITGLPTQGSLLTFNPFSNKLYTNGSNSTPLTVIDGATHAVSSIAGIHATAVTVNPVTNRVYATNFPAVWSSYAQTATIAVIDGSTQTVLANVPVGQAGSGAEAIAIDTVSNEIYVPNGEGNGVGNYVSVIDGATNTVSATVATDWGPGAVVVDEANHRAFVLNERLLPQGNPTGSIFVIASPKDDGPTLAPAIAAAFGAATIAVNGTTSLNFTITNPNSSYTLSSVSFQAQLPSGLQATAGTTAACGGALTTAPSGSITVSGALVAPGSPCVVSLTVTGTAAGTYTVASSAVTAWPSLTGNTASATITVTLTTNKTTPTITWSTPAAITYGTPLSATQLNATASVAGTFAYLPVSGTVLGAGQQTLTVSFTPTDTTDYNNATATVSLTVNKATPSLVWATPAAITYGTPLSATQLNATASVAGTFAYLPVSGTVLGAGQQTLTVSFTPTDTADYSSTSTATVPLTVNAAIFTVSGTVTFGGQPLSGVTMSGLPGNPITDSSGNYSAVIGNGTVYIGTPTLAGYTFTPSSVATPSAPVISIVQNFTAVYTPPQVTTATTLGALSSTITSGGNVVTEGKFGVTAKGVCWSKTVNPSSANSCTNNGTGAGAFVSTITGLSLNTAYHVRAYATSLAGTAYGADMQFTTSQAAGPFAYITGLDDNSLSVIDTATNTVSSTLAIADGPRGVAVNPAAGTVYVVQENSWVYMTKPPTATVIDAKTDSVTGTLNLFGISPGNAVASPDGSKIYVGGDVNSGAVDVIDTKTAAVSYFNSGDFTFGLAVHPDGSRLYLTSLSPDVVVVDLSSNTVTGTINVGNGPRDVAINAAGTRAYVPNADDNTVSVIDVATGSTTINTVLKVINVGNGPRGAALNQSGTRLYVTNQDDNTVSVIDTTNDGDAVIGTVNVGNGPYGIAMHPDGIHLYVIQRIDNTVSVIDTTNDKDTVTNTISVGKNPYQLGQFFWTPPSQSKATPTITWATPVAITYGTALDSTQLNATASYSGSPVAGTFAYSPAAGTVINAGMNQTLSVTFTPTDTTDYNTATGSVSLTVNQAMPTITWATPAAITYATALSATQLDATANVPGTFAYYPQAGAYVNAGHQTLLVTFTPNDTTNYTTATGRVPLTVNQATPTINWAAPAAITYGTALGSAQLNATDSFNGVALAGTFAYTPATGTVLNAGVNQTLSVTFTPSDTTDFTTATGSVSLTVNKAAPSITWTTPAAITYGTPLSAAQLNATASVPGTFAYLPVAGTVLGAGTQTLTATFTPTDTTDYSIATATVSLTVNSPPVITLQPTNQTVTLGNAATFTATATGTPALTYSWQYFQSGAWHNWGVGTGFKTANFTTLATTVNYNGLQFRVIVTDGNGLTATSNTVTLTVNSPPVITLQPTSQTATLGNSATFTVAATGTPALTYSWQYFHAGAWHNWGVGTGFKTANFTTLATTANYNGLQFRVIVTDGNSLTATSNTVTLTVNSPPVITLQPTNQTVTLGNSATFTVAATGTPALTYSWQYFQAGAWHNWGVGTGFKTSTFTTLATNANYNGLQFRVIVTDGNGLTATSNTVTLTVNSPPVITLQPTNQTVTLGNAATFTVTATGTPALTYSWQYFQAGAWHNWGVGTGFKTANFTTLATTANYNGLQFRVIVTDGNSLTAISNTVTLTVQ
jgi:YVTN family beta-propeller protein